MNEITLEYLDKKNKMGRVLVNGKYVPINFIQIYKNENDFNGKLNYTCRVCNDWNISNPLTFQAPTIKGLIGQLKRHKYTLKHFST